MNYVKRGLTISQYRKRFKDSDRMFKEFSKLIKALSEQTKLTIIVRPHPIDNLKIMIFLANIKM